MGGAAGGGTRCCSPNSPRAVSLGGDTCGSDGRWGWGAEQHRAGGQSILQHHKPCIPQQDTQHPQQHRPCIPFPPPGTPHHMLSMGYRSPTPQLCTPQHPTSIAIPVGTTASRIPWHPQHHTPTPPPASHAVLRVSCPTPPPTNTEQRRRGGNKHWGPIEVTVPAQHWAQSSSAGSSWVGAGGGHSPAVPMDLSAPKSPPQPHTSPSPHPHRCQPALGTPQGTGWHRGGAPGGSQPNPWDYPSRCCAK